MKPIISIGLDPHVVEAIQSKIGRHISDYQYLPNIFAIDGEAYVQSQSGSYYIRPAGILYYCYFESPEIQRRALALADTPTFPYVRQTILHDDKVLSLIAARNADYGEKDVRRGFAFETPTVNLKNPTVAKWGKWHCGDGKKICEEYVDVPEPAILEPFIEGESHRILIVNHDVWQIKYESDDWRKNVNSKITVLDRPDQVLADRAVNIANKLNLKVCGIDFIINSNGAYLLEANAYPGLYQVPQAEEAFINFAASWASTLEK